jgi:hypothetical protein
MLSYNLHCVPYSILRHRDVCTGGGGGGRETRGSEESSVHS